MSEHDIPQNPLDIAYGDLNDVSKPTIRKRFNLDNDQTFQAIAVATADSYTPDGLANVGQFKGVCLKVVTGPSTVNQVQEKGSWLTNFFGDTATPESSQSLQIVEIKVRVPEVHSMLPIPNSIGPDATEEDHLIMDMYPTFVGQSTAVQEPEPGDLVWVDWGNRQNWTDPYYIRPVKEEFPMAMGAGGVNPAGAVDAFGRPCAGTYSAQPPSGDAIAGTNVSIKPFAGLPRLKRSGSPQDVSLPGVFLESHNYFAQDADPIAQGWWMKVQDSLPLGTAFMGPIKGNGTKDPEHKHGKRSTLIWCPDTIDFKQPWELIYFFHGQGEFSLKALQEQIADQIKKTASEGRNFVLVVPELPWSKRGTSKKRSRLGFNSSASLGGPEAGGGAHYEHFVLFHNEIVKKILDITPAFVGSDTLTKELRRDTPAFISIFAHSAGGSALGQIAINGALAEVAPHRIFLSDGDFGWYPGGVTQTVFDKYVKDNKHVWFTIMTTETRKPRVKANKFITKNAAAIKGRAIYHIPVKKSHDWCGANCINIIAEEHQKRFTAEENKKAAKQSEGKPNDEEGEENKVEEKSIEEAEQGKPKTAPETPPKKEDASENPPAQRPENAPSQNTKQSDTSKKPLLTGDWKVEALTHYQENRVRVKHYGGSLVGKAKDKLLEEVEHGVKLHKLMAVRYRAIKKAAIEAGFKDFKISSGWRKHRWKGKEHYLQALRDRYGTPKGHENGIKKGKPFLAYASPHEMGLAMDVKAHGVFASYKGTEHLPEQFATPLFAWMKENMHKYGFTPFKKEAWHWELRLPYDSYASGEEFTEDFAVKVTDMGKKTVQLPGGPSTGGSRSGGGGAPCVSTNGGPIANRGITPIGAYTPGPPFTVTGAGSLGSNLVGGRQFQSPSDKNPLNKEVTLFVCHETAGSPHGHKRLDSWLKKRDPKKGVHYWGSCEGKIVQCCPPETKLWHANNTNSWSVGIELMGMSSTGTSGWKNGGLEKGLHYVTHKGKGDIHCEPGYVTAVSPWSGCAHLPTPQQLDSMWKLIVTLSKSPAPMAIPIAFPCVPDKDKFWWTKWNGGPSKDYNASKAWFGKHKPAGIVSHHRIYDHYDGMMPEYYAFGRAQGLNHKDAYWALVGALCSGKKENGMVWTKGPKDYVALGKKKFPAEWFNQKTEYWVGASEWAELKSANPQWFA